MAMQALVMGFGGTGAHVLTALKELTVLKHGRVPEAIKFLLFDTIADWEPGMVQIVGGASEEKTAKSEDEAASLDPGSEYFQLADFAPDLQTHVRDLSQDGIPDEYKHLKNWLHAPWLTQNVSTHQLAITIGAAQQRQIGRYAMFKNAEKIIAHLRPIIRNLSTLAGGSDVNVWLVCSAAGGTGAGCLIDAAYLTRLAADNLKIKVSGVIVLPNVYMNVSGISHARAYSLLRELERVQEQGIPQSDRYIDMKKRKKTSSRVVYDRNWQQVALVDGRLFSDLFYLGSNCPTEGERRKFFTSVASAIDPYLDAQSGRKLLEKAVNDTAAASAFGAARIYVPTDTFGEMFAWEQVAEYLRRAAAPKEVGDRVERLFVGSDQDRAESGTQKFRALLKLFNELLDSEKKPERARETFARDELDARSIVTLWYELTGSRTPDEKTVMLTYVEPCYSLTEPERPRESKEWEAKTYRENSADPHGIKETQEESRNRFADRLEEIRKRYINPNGGDRTFEKGRLHVLETISKRLKAKVDELFVGELERRRGEFAQSNTSPEQGTPLTQLFAEVTWMLGDQGPLRIVHKVVGEFVAAVAKEQVDRENRYTRAQQELRESKRGGIFNFGAWVEDYQKAARDECTDYIRWFQKYELLKNMQKLILNVEQRLRDWERLLSQVFDALVRREGRREEESSALFKVTQIYLKGTLEERLYRAARNRSALISFGEQPDPQMHGYQEELRSQSAQGLAAALLTKSHWEASVTAEGVPRLALVIDSSDLAQQSYSPGDIRNLPGSLHKFFHGRIVERLRNTDVFDYLLWLRKHRNIEPGQVVDLLNAEASTLIDAGGVPETRTLIYKEPAGSNKKDLADALALRLDGLEGVERDYSDHNAITLMKVKKPGLDKIADIQSCRQEYSMLRADQLNEDEEHDTKLRRAQVFHPFRQEMEAWYIERYYRRKVSSDGESLVPPRIARLLEDPEMMQIFVHGIATGAVEHATEGWVWNGPDSRIWLTDSDADPDDDVVKAAVVFTLKQGQGKDTGLTDISREAARQSVTKSAQANGKTRDEMLVKFVNTKLNKFLEDNAPEHLRAALKMVFTFYCDPKTRTALRLRVDLP